MHLENQAPYSPSTHLKHSQAIMFTPLHIKAILSPQNALYIPLTQPTDNLTHLLNP